MRKPPDNFTAYDLTLRALDAINTLERERFDEAIVYLKRAMELDPNFAMPVAWAARWHSLRIGQGWSDDREADAKRAAELASEAIALDRSNALALATYGHIKSYLFRDFDSGMLFLDRAREAGPSHALAWMLSAVTMAFVGRGEEAVEHADFALRLSPFDQYLFLHYHALSIAHYSAGNAADAVRWGKRSEAENPLSSSNLRIYSAALALAGELTEARAVTKKLLELEPGFTIDAMRRSKRPFRDEDRREAFYADLKAAGAPD